ncbi:MAG: hypothetical protein GY946_10895 [bacterium]|nr:hypothetical protein [bacterium]
MTRTHDLRSILIVLLAFPLLGGTASASEYDVRSFEDKAHLYRFGPDLVPVLEQSSSFFMGLHVRQHSRPSSEPPVLLSLASSTVGNNRYLRLQTKKPTGEIEVQAYSRGSGGTDLRLAVGDPLEFGTWYTAGVLVEASASGWTFTVFRQKHGSSELESATDSTPSLPYPTLNLYTVARIAYVKSTNGPIYSAHNLTGDTAAPVFVQNPSLAEIEAFMGSTDPHAIWTIDRFLAAPNLGSVRDETDNAAWTIGGNAADTQVVGTMDLAGPLGGGGGVLEESPMTPVLLP